jgi:hypothetical protein
MESRYRLTYNNLLYIGIGASAVILKGGAC